MYAIRTPLEVPGPPRLQTGPPKLDPTLPPPYGIRVANKVSRYSRTEHALRPYSRPRQGSNDATWALGAWCKPSHGSKASARIKCKTTKACSNQAQGIDRLVTGLCNRSRVIEAHCSIAASRIKFPLRAPHVIEVDVPHARKTPSWSVVRLGNVFVTVIDRT
jgi:hypothetical protein